MFILEKEIPDYLTSRKNIVALVVFTAVFALIFINVYAPFEVKSQLDVNKIQLFLYSSLVILTGMLVIVISRIIMFLYSRFKSLNYWQYAIWVLGEILSMAFVYAIFVRFILQYQRDFIDIMTASIKNTSLVLLLPYTIIWLYLSWRENAVKLDKFSDEGLAGSTPSKMIPFHDEKGTMRISIIQDDLVYLSSADNYVTLHYVSGSKMSKFLIRNSLKNYEELFRPLHIIRCHRSFMVNVAKVKIIRKEKDGFHLELDAPSPTLLPVSAKYFTNIMEVLSKFTTSV